MLDLKEFSNVFFFWKGRVALYAILKALDIKKGDEIILPAFTCVAVPNPIKYLGAKPVYVDVCSKTFNIDVRKIEEKISDKTKVIISQNTFGLSSDLDPILELAKKHNLNVVEDCAHGYGGTYKGKQNGTVTDAAFYSTQWNKMFSTGIGGIAVTENNEIAKKIKSIETDAYKPSIRELISLKLQIFARDHLLNDVTYWGALSLYRWLSKHNLITGSSQGYELERPEMPENFIKGFSKIQHRRLAKELKRIEENLSHRKYVAARYKEILEKMGLGVPCEPEYAEHTFMKFPLLVEKREDFMKRAEKAHIELGDWFLSPVHPVTKNLHLWDYHMGKNPVAEYLSEHMVNLPTHIDIDDKNISRIELFLQEHSERLIPYANPGVD